MCFETLKEYFKKFRQNEEPDNFDTLHLAVIFYIIILRTLESEMSDMLEVARHPA